MRRVHYEKGIGSVVSTVVASLPMSLSIGVGGNGAILFIDGRIEWANRLADAIRAGYEAAIVVAPAELDERELAVIPDDFPVALDWRFASNPALDEIDVQTSGGLIEVTAYVPLARQSEVTSLELRLLIRRLFDADILFRGAVGPGGRRSLEASGSRTVLSRVIPTDACPSALEISWVGREGRSTLRIPNPSTAQPASVLTTDAAFDRSPSTMYENSHRATARRLLRALDDATPLADLKLLRRVVRAPQ